MYERHDPERTGDGEPGQRTGVSPTLIALGIVAIVAVIFIAQNNERRSVDFLFFDFTTRVWVALLAAMVIGALLDRLLTAWWRRRKNRSSDS
jgi:uncharacterized integral membrane protein